MHTHTHSLVATSVGVYLDFFFHIYFDVILVLFVVVFK